METTTHNAQIKIPAHVAIIMDGNGRWAKARGLNRNAGHQKGVDTVREITSAAARLGMKYLTLYTFSTENWNRPSDEVAALMSLILTSMEEELFMKNNVSLRVIGDLKRLPENIQEAGAAHLRQYGPDAGHRPELLLAMGNH